MNAKWPVKRRKSHILSVNIWEMSAIRSTVGVRVWFLCVSLLSKMQLPGGMNCQLQLKLYQFERSVCVLECCERCMISEVCIRIELLHRLSVWTSSFNVAAWISSLPTFSMFCIPVFLAREAQRPRFKGRSKGMLKFQLRYLLYLMFSVYCTSQPKASHAAVASAFRNWGSKMVCFLVCCSIYVFVFLL